MSKEYRQIEWDASVEDDCRQLVRLAVREDLDRFYDWTTVILVPEDVPGRATVAARGAGRIAGLPAGRVVLDEYDRRLEWAPLIADGQVVQPGDAIASLAGSARSLLAVERPLLNILGRLSGIATLAAEYVERVSGTGARIYDTRKTMPGWRRLEKYAVRQGGAWNHRLGLFDGVLIKDNHLALGAGTGGTSYTPAEAVLRAREFLARLDPGDPHASSIVEVEVDTWEQFVAVLPAAPDIVLLDNMRPEQLRRAVEYRNEHAPEVELEASGGIRLDTVRAVAESGVERISAGAITHSAVWFDVGLDWG